MKILLERDRKKCGRCLADLWAILARQKGEMSPYFFSQSEARIMAIGERLGLTIDDITEGRWK